MAETREFIAAKDLPVTEAEEVNVLVVDPATGELAQKSASGFGDGSQSKIEIVNVLVLENRDNERQVIGYTYEELRSVLSNPQTMVFVQFKECSQDEIDSGVISTQFTINNSVHTINFNDDNISFIGDMSYYWYSDGHWDQYAD